MMDKLIEYCQARYAEEIEYKFSLSNIICWLLFLVALHSFYKIKLETLIQAIKELSLKEIFDTGNGILLNAPLSQILIAIAFAAFTSAACKKLSGFLFYLFSLKSDFTQLIIEITFKFLKNKNTETKKFLAENAREKLSTNQRKLKRLNSLSEICLCISISSFIGLKLNPINCITATAGILVFLYLSWKSFQLFIEEILPYFTAIKYSEDELTELMSAFEDSIK